MNRENRKYLGAALAAVITCASAFSAAAQNDDLNPYPVPTSRLVFKNDAIDLRKNWNGAKNYCKTYKDKCTELERTRKDEIVILTPEKWKTIIKAFFKPKLTIVPDLEKYPDDADAENPPDVWTHGEDGKGDCEDFILAWDDAFEEIGVPKSVYVKVIVTVPDLETRKSGKQTNQKHMIGVLRTSRGDFFTDMSHQGRLIPLNEMNPAWRIYRVESPTRRINWVSAKIVAPAQTNMAKTRPVQLTKPALTVGNGG